jgi:hypothetical protein
LSYDTSMEFVNGKSTFVQRLDMSSEVTDQRPPEDVFVEELVAQLSDPIHKRIIQAHTTADPVQSMEFEIGKVLLEVLIRED